MIGYHSDNGTFFFKMVDRRQKDREREKGQFFFFVIFHRSEKNTLNPLTHNRETRVNACVCVCVCVSVVAVHKKGKERMEGVGETEEGGVSRPQKSIGWEERAEIICAVRGQRGRANGGGGDRANIERLQRQ